MYGNSYKNVETDYTGRWKILTENNESHLYIECFELEMKMHKINERIDYEDVPVYGNIFRWLLRKPIRIKQRVISRGHEEVYRPHAVVTWVHEDSLTYQEEFINTCSGDCE